jgi:hypothetical protein
MKNCTSCGRVMAKNDPYWQKITGWVAGAKRDSVTLRRDVEPPEFACKGCIVKEQHGINMRQEAWV